MSVKLGLISRANRHSLSLSLAGRFSNVRFTVMDGASLIFDFDKTEFGPNSDFVSEAVA